MKRAVLLIVASVVFVVMVGCGTLGERDKSLVSKEGQKVWKIRIIVNPPCPEGWERVDQTIFGIQRLGCYPIDFDYDKANEKLAEYLAREATK